MLVRTVELRTGIGLLRRPVNKGNLFEGKSLRRYVFNSFRERFNGSTCSPEDIAGFLEGATECITLEDSDPLHRADISLNEVEVAISRLPQGKAAGWDGIPCELVKGFEDFFGGVIHQVLAESKLRGTLPESSRRNIICLVPKAHGGSGLSGYRPISLPTADYRIVSSVLLGRLRRHLPAIVPDCQTYAVPGRCPSWNIACVSDEVAQAFKNKTPLAVISTDLQSAFDNVDREFLASQLRIIGLPPPFMEWLHLLYAEADATIKVDGNFTRPFKMRRGLRQGCACSAALFSIFTGPLLRHLERILGRGNVLAYADDILLLIREDWQFERVKTVFDEFRRASGVSVNFPKSKGLWCGAWRDRADSPLGISWSASSITVLGCEITSGHGTSVQENHLLGILERSISRWSPFVRGFSLVGRARAANSLVLAAVLHHLHGYLPGDATIAKLQARLTRFVWGSCHRAAWLPGGLLARPVSVGGVGLLDIRTQLQLACFKGVQAASRNGGKNAYSWLVESGAWMTPLSSGSWLLPRRRRLLDLWGQASSILGLNHRVLPAPTLLNLPLVGACRFLATPSLRAPSRWRGVRVRDLASPAPPPIARLTRSACEDAAALGAFCQRLVADNATSIYRERTLEEAVVLRGTATPFLRISTRTARRMLERPRLAAVPISRYLRRWAPVVDVPSTSLASSSLRRCSFGGHAADIALRLALHALPHPGHPASSQPVCIACGSSDLSLAHRYWSCSAVRPLIREVFSIIGRPPDLQSWIFAVNLENHAITISSAAKHAIYVFFVDREMRGIYGDPLAIFHQTLQRWQRRHQKLCRLATCEDMLEMTRTDPEWKDKIITGDETWVYGYDPETKRQSAEWRGQDSPVRRADRIVDAKVQVSKKTTVCTERWNREEGRIQRSPWSPIPTTKMAKTPLFQRWKTPSVGRRKSPPARKTPRPMVVSDVLGSLTRTVHQLSAATGPSRDVELSRYDGSYEAQSFFDNYDAQADLAQLKYTERLRRLPNLLQDDQNNSQPFLRTVTKVQCSATVVSTAQLRCQSTPFILQVLWRHALARPVPQTACTEPSKTCVPSHNLSTARKNCVVLSHTLPSFQQASACYPLP
ncbi:hypothetical protein LAZ67_18001276 [Cordylochernes scorpioides]|uniref:Reverse transcriptase domain-containing protein n=1 Tax=Cordylochernes scorpioides TaxID=51811 RepID=A0ABY6LFR8_9ARAC|nr:hypothetical protein LAZ67_18001276 [Cordylochernes scorpioides]